MTAYPDGKMKWILHYQDHHDKMSYLRAIPDKEAKTMALELVSLFLMQGAPVISQSDNGREFVAKIIDEMLLIWKECKIVHGSPRYPQSQGSVERANADVQSMVMQWIEDENNTNWTWGIQFIAHKKTIDIIQGLNKSRMCSGMVSLVVLVLAGSTNSGSAINADNGAGQPWQLPQTLAALRRQTMVQVNQHQHLPQLHQE